MCVCVCVFVDDVKDKGLNTLFKILFLFFHNKKNEHLKFGWYLQHQTHHSVKYGLS